MVDSVDSTAPATAGRSSSGARKARSPMAPMVAMLDTKPDAKPATGRPKRGPSRRSAMWPAAPIDIIRTTMVQMVRGLMASKGPM